MPPTTTATPTPPAASHTRTSRSRDCSEYRFGRSSGGGDGLPRPTSASLRLAVLLPIANTEHISSRMRPLSFFDAFMYSSLNLRVTCRFVAMLIPSSIRQAKQDRYRSRSFPMRHVAHAVKSRVRTIMLDRRVYRVAMQAKGGR